MIQLRKKAYKWIDYGADLIIGNHSHVIQGRECYKGKYIYYSLGNFIFPNYLTKDGVKKEWSKKSNMSITLKIHFNEEINIEETGCSFEQKSLSLRESSVPLKEIESKSTLLNFNETSFKKYYGIWLKNYYHVLKNEYGMKYRIKRLIFQKI
jgi:poly-gamma-glutamate synthesis protein (capsule biosynthesis protein)